MFKIIALMITTFILIGCSSPQLPPVERIVTKTIIQKIAVEPPRKPDQIAEIDFDKWEVLTQLNIAGELKKVESGDREPLNHMALPYNSYLDLATWMRSVENYVIAAEQYFKDVDADYNKIMQAPPEP